MYESLFYIFFYFITGCIIHVILAVWEGRSLNTEVYDIVIWPIAFIQYLVRSWKNIKESD
jgi:hypothetical protein